MTSLVEIHLPSRVNERPISAAVLSRLTVSRERIDAFQDRWGQPNIEQFVAADYELVYQTLGWVLETQFMLGGRFLEWGCGFAVVSALAAGLKLNVAGIEAEPVLLEQGRRTIAEWDVDADLVRGDFLPLGTDQLANDPMLPSLGHDAPSGYTELGLDPDDFAIIYGYPWPGEEVFHQDVFAASAARGALLLQFCGPNDMRLFRKS